MLIPALGIIGAAISSSISYWVTAVLIVAVFRRLSGRSLAETLVLRPRDIAGPGRHPAPSAGRRWSAPRPRDGEVDRAEPAARSTGEPAEPGPGEEP